MGSYKWSYKSPIIGYSYNYGYSPFNTAYNYP